ncbi:MAG: alpha/beta hydrolase fold domain-containing protein [Bacteroidaceae bacterium]|nr:alpha/beta hydrolase fold domain-containing protein [Bacteroidaceae bacterium]
MKKYLFLLLASLTGALTLQAQTARKFTIDLTDDGKAQMLAFLPEKPSGRAIVGIPGGGYSVLSNSHEGTHWAEWLNQRGIAYFVVNYRLPQGNRNIPIGDVEKGFKIVRDSAAVWGIQTRDVGIMGFSAGGHLASVISTLSPYEVRPDFSILFYPVISMDERVSHVYSCRNFLGEDQKNPEMVRDFSTQNAVKRHLTPPAVIFMSSDDNLVPPVTNGVAYYSAMRNAGNECAMYIYPTGGHGWGFGPWFKYHDQLLTEFGNWLDAHPAPQQDAIRVACIGNSITDGHGIEMAPVNGYPALLQRQLGKDYLVKNFGVSGRTLLNHGDMPYMKEMAWKDAQAFDPDIVVIKLGTNDSKPQNWKYAAEFKQDLQQMITTLCPALAQSAKKGKKSKKSKNAQPVRPKIYLCTPIPAFKSSWNINDAVITNEIIPIQKEVAQQYGLQLIDLHTLFANDGDKMQEDGIHPDGKGVRRIADIVAEALKK